MAEKKELSDTALLIKAVKEQTEVLELIADELYELRKLKYLEVKHEEFMDDTADDEDIIDSDSDEEEEVEP